MTPPQESRSQSGAQLRRARLATAAAARPAASAFRHGPGELRPCRPAAAADGVTIYENGVGRLDPLPPPTVPRAEVIDELYAAVVDGRAPLHDGAWAMATMEVCLAMLRSAREGARDCAAASGGCADDRNPPIPKPKHAAALARGGAERPPCTSVRDAARALVRSLSVRLAEHQVSFGHWSFLRVLWVGDGLTQRELSERAGRHGADDISGDQDNGAAWLCRAPPARRRPQKIYIHLTPKGRSLERTAGAARRRGQPGCGRGHRAGARREHSRGVARDDRKSCARRGHFGKADAIDTRDRETSSESRTTLTAWLFFGASSGQPVIVKAASLSMSAAGQSLENLDVRYSSAFLQLPTYFR